MILEEGSWTRQEGTDSLREFGDLGREADLEPNADVLVQCTNVNGPTDLVTPTRWDLTSR